MSSPSRQSINASGSARIACWKARWIDPPRRTAGARSLSSLEPARDPGGAAPATFGREPLEETLKAHGARNAAGVERRRLDLYRRVATPAAFEQARRQVEAFAVPLEAEWPREAEAQRRLAEAEEARKAEEARMAAEQKAQRRAGMDRCNMYLCSWRPGCHAVAGPLERTVRRHAAWSMNSTLMVSYGNSTCPESVRSMTPALRRAVKSL